MIRTKAVCVAAALILNSPVGHAAERHERINGQDTPACTRTEMRAHLPVARNNMTTALECIDAMIADYLMADGSIMKFAKRWEGPGGMQYQLDGRNLSNINPCPQFFENVLLFVPYREHDGGSLNFQLRPHAKVTLRDMELRFGAHQATPRDRILAGEAFRYSASHLRFDATIYADFVAKHPGPSDQVRLLTVVRGQKNIILQI